MKTENGKIVEATESELYSIYLERNYDEFMSFIDYKLFMETHGCNVIEQEN